MPNQDPRVLVVSARNLYPQLSRCAVCEFEDVVASHDRVEMMVPASRTRQIPERISHYSRRLGLQLASTSTPAPMKVTGRYPLFAMFAQGAADIHILKSIEGWRDKCDRAVVFLTDVWRKDLHPKLVRQTLSQFDEIFLMNAGSVERVRELSGKQVHFLPAAVDALGFAPGPVWPDRSIDLYYMGRRSEVAHEAFLNWAKTSGRFYLFDTIGARIVYSAAQHRHVLQDFVKRSKFFIVNKGLVDRSATEDIQDEVPARFFEGAAGGAVLVGDPPKTPILSELFHWEDAIIELPFNSTEGPQLVESLESQPERMAAVRRRNVIECLRRHDWIHRWQSMLAAVGMSLEPAGRERLERLEAAAKTVEAG